MRTVRTGSVAQYGRGNRDRAPFTLTCSGRTGDLAQFGRRLHGIVRARESGQMAPGSGARCR